MNTKPPFSLHSSAPDWVLGAFCLIDPTQFTSPPTSLSLQDLTSCTAVLQTAPLTNVPYGRLDFDLYSVPFSPLGWPRTEVAFRLRSDIFPPISRDYYSLKVWHGDHCPPGEDPVQIIRQNALPTVLASYGLSPPLDTWLRFRITFIPLCTAPHPKPLLITVHYFEDPGWTYLFGAIDPTDSWATRSENTIGFSLIDDQHWIDDASLYEFT